ncbi:lasso peptide biosynthesis PqqD family chaperone [Metabacillus halosaccharovorans]|uniref:lasso peptide biosynthesis PqqD family chaperone n=1 Tax=Metabacillus halosaccharovorans TaxID=930124 RepID=UPI001C1FF33F|nr:lasso peptide biosynthesis PqqD family chaperone [Metabacillus halosaccharovorans]MBU7593507.1 lasso peptide biosynthesis PqqD family chaperone [Metabacillus halosaccharovorans]
MKTYELITLEDIVTQVEGNVCSDMDGEKVMLSIKNGKYYNLGETGGVIWDLIEKPMKVNEIIKKMKAIYDVNDQDCELQVRSFLENLISEGLIEKNL